MISRKKNTKDNGGRHIAVVAVCLGLLLLAGIGIGAALGIGKLTEIWQEQCRVNDPEIQAVIDNRSTRKMVHDEIVITHFSLTNGANLATIPFAELRRELLDRVPNIRDIRIERTLPNRVTVKVDERSPIARVGLRGRNGASGGRVADLEGVVFRYSNKRRSPSLERRPRRRRLRANAFQGSQPRRCALWTSLPSRSSPTSAFLRSTRPLPTTCSSSSAIKTG